MRTEHQSHFVAPSEEDIAEYARHLWEYEGRQHGRDLQYWLEAKAHLTVHRQYEAGLLVAASQRQRARA